MRVSELVVNLLQGSEPMTVAELRAAIMETGEFVTSKQVASCLRYLKLSGAIQQGDRPGKWRLSTAKPLT